MLSHQREEHGLLLSPQRGDHGLELSLQRGDHGLLLQRESHGLVFSLQPESHALVLYLQPDEHEPVVLRPSYVCRELAVLLCYGHETETVVLLHVDHGLVVPHCDNHGFWLHGQWSQHDNHEWFQHG